MYFQVIFTEWMAGVNFWNSNAPPLLTGTTNMVPGAINEYSSSYINFIQEYLS